MRIITLFTILLSLLLFSCNTNQPKIYNAADFDIFPNQEKNISPLIASAIEQIKSQSDGKPAVLLFEKGVYNFYPTDATQREYYISNNDQNNPKTVGIALENMENFTIDGAQSDFMFHGRMLPISLLGSKNCTIKNLSIDNPNPQIAQIEVVENDTIKGEITYRLAPWVKYRIEDGKFVAYGENWQHTQGSGIAFEKNTRHLVYRTSDIRVGTKDIIEIEPRLIKAPWKDSRLVPTTIVAMRTWHRPTPGIFMSHNLNTNLKNVTVHFAEGMGLLAQVCENITLEDFNVALRGESDPRYFTTQADATHFSGCKGVISSKGGLYEGMMDDAINVHGTYLKVIERIDDKTLIAKYMHSQAYGFEWGMVGDSVQFVKSQTMELLDGVNSISAITPHDRPTIEGAKEYKISFTTPLPDIIDGQTAIGIENLEWTPEVIFADNIIRNNRARGTLFSTPKLTIIENNLFDHTSGTAILLCGDCNGWYETGACRDVIIRGNTFINSLTNMFQFTNAIISIYPEIPNLKEQTKFFHGGNGAKGVVIENNIFETFDAPIVYAKSLDGLTFTNNTIKHNEDYKPFHWNNAPFLFERVTNITIDNNNFDNGFDPQTDIKHSKIK